MPMKEICRKSVVPVKNQAITLAFLFLGGSALYSPQEVQSMPVSRDTSWLQSHILNQALAQTPSGQNLHCEIRGHVEFGLLNLQGVVWADDALIGSYSFDLVKRGSFGNSSTSQRGVFSLDPNQEKVVGSITVNVPAGHTYHAQLQVLAGDTDVSCDFNFG